jgi:CTP synthase (UTP-ammonia lyase)
MEPAIRIGIIGDFEPTYHSHFATNAALYDAATMLKVGLKIRWLPTPSLDGPDAEKILRRWDGLIASPGSPYKSFTGMLRGIEFARTRDWPFVGTWGGFQYTLVEYARNVLKIADADTAENNSGSSHCVVTPLSCALPNRRDGGPKGSGEERLTILPKTLLHSICGSEDVSEQYYCNYGVNEEYEKQFQAAALRVSARGILGETRAVELADHRFFIATLFQPQLSSRPEMPHRFLLAFLRAAMRFRKARSEEEAGASRGSGKQGRR